jgi:xylan 1,4-beta-xylosidase
MHIYMQDNLPKCVSPLQTQHAAFLSVSTMFVKSLVGIAAYALLVGVSQAAFPDCTNGPLRNNSVCNPSLPAEQRAKALVKVLNVTEKIGQLVNGAPAIPRLGLPAYNWWNEALHGLAFSPGVSFGGGFGGGSGNFSSSTSFPQPITMGAAFNDPLIEKVANVIAREARAFSNYNHSYIDYWV